jgi:beta-galactosidase GanA
MSLLDRIAFGSSYYPPHHTPDDWVHDLDRMASCGLRVIRTAELLASWDRIEIAKHEYDFGWLDRLFELAGERGIKILLGTGSCCPPIWMAAEFPDLPVLSRDGVRYPTGAVWSWACRNHPELLKELERWIRVLAARYGEKHELLGWQIDNEPSHPCQPRGSGELDFYCYCPYTEERFRDWLRQRYETPETLSEAWRWDPTNHRYSDWSQVRAPRALPIEWGVVTAWLDWRRFVVDDLAAFIAWQRQLLHQLTPNLPATTNVLAWSRFDPFGVLMGHDARRLAAVVDAIGFDIYPSIRRRFLEQPESVPLYLDYARSIAQRAERELWVTEAESGPLHGWVLGPDHPTSATDILRLNAEAIGAGARLFLYQGFREWNCIPIHWGALVDLRGRPTPRLDAAAAVARAVEAETDLFLEAESALPDVVILHDFDNAAVIEGMAAGSFLRDALWGAYTAFAGGGFEVGFASSGDLERLQCRLLVLPFTMVVPAETATALAEFVASGGTVLAFAKVAMLDGRGWYWDLRPGAGLDELFGVEEESIEVVDEQIAVAVPRTDRLPGWDGGDVDGYWHRQLLSLRPGTEVLGRFHDGSPALVYRRHGAGRAFLFATHADVAVKRLAAPATEELLQSIAAAAGARRLFRAERASDGLPRVWARRRRNGNRSIVTVTSTADEATEAVVLADATAARDLVLGESLPIEDGVVRVPVDARSARIVLLEELA